MAVMITGASDDTIVISGDIYEELYALSSDETEKRLLAFSDGTLLSAVFDEDGIWRLNRIAIGSARLEKVDGVAMDDTNDVVTLFGDIRWVVLGKEYATP